MAMATCPQCGRFLDEHHRCVNRWRRRVRVWRTDLMGAFVGGLAGFLLLSLLYGDAHWPAVTGAAITGVLIKRAVNQDQPPALWP
jgi:hypothetical protein